MLDDLPVQGILKGAHLQNGGQQEQSAQDMLPAQVRAVMYVMHALAQLLKDLHGKDEASSDPAGTVLAASSEPASAQRLYSIQPQPHSNQAGLQQTRRRCNDLNAAWVPGGPCCRLAGN